MYSRLFTSDKTNHQLILGPRGTGKTYWLKHLYNSSIYIDLLNHKTLNELRTHPENIWNYIPEKYKGAVIIDEVQRVPGLFDIVHQYTNEEHQKIQFIMSGSSARKLKRDGVNLLAGRARVQHFYPLTALELGEDFNLKKALQYGLLPEVWTKSDPEDFLNSYLSTYIDQEVRLEGLARNTSDFSRFLESASLSQGQVLNIENVSSDCHVPRKTVEGYFQVLEDLMIANRISVFQKKAKRELIKHKKFYFFDCGVYQTIRPRGFLDSGNEVGGNAFETLILQNLIAVNSLLKLKNEIFFWRTKKHIEVDFIIYGKNTLLAIEVKNQNRLRQGDLDGLHEFKKDYPTARCLFIYTGREDAVYQDIELIPVQKFLFDLPKFLGQLPKLTSS